MKILGSYLLIRQCIRRVSTSLLRPTTKDLSKAALQNTNTEASTVKDIILYKFEKPRFFKYLNFFAITQYGFWTFISVSAFSMVNIPVPELTKEEAEETPFWRKMNLGSDKYKYGLAIGAGFMGFSILFLSWMYISRTIRYVVLRKDAKTISFVLYAPFGRNRILDVPLTNISAEGSRASGTTQMPVKVKGKSLFYLIDLKEGKFLHP